MDPDEVAELCEDFFSDLMGDEAFWRSAESAARPPGFKLVDVEVDEDIIRLLVEPGNGVDEDDDQLAEVLDRAISALTEAHDELADYRISYKIETD